jgi:hypothetical protein
MSAPEHNARELIALAGPVQCEQPAGAVNLVLRGQAGALPGALPGAARDASAGLTEVLFSDATAVTLPDSLHDVRVIELLDASAAAAAFARVDTDTDTETDTGAARHFRLQGPQLALELRARSVQLHRDAAADFYRAVPPPRVPLRVRLGWSLLLSALRLPGAVALLRRLRGAT